MESKFLSVADSGRIKVLGLLAVETVADYQHRGYEALQKVAREAVIDLAEAEVVGSAVIALLLSWQRRAHQLGKGFAIANAPDHLVAMADLSGLQKVMPFQK